MGKKSSNAPEWKGRAVEPYELDKIAQKARRETEDFLNNHIQDPAKGWPVSCPSRGETGKSPRGRQVTERAEKTHTRISV